MVIKNIDATTIAKKFLVRGYNINPKAAAMLCSCTNVDEVIDEICRIADGKFIIDERDVTLAIEAVNSRNQLPIEEPKSVHVQKNADQKIRVLRDVTGNSVCEGKVEDFTVYFKSRFEKLARILRSRVASTPIANLGKLRSDSVNVIGMVSDVRESRNSYVVELEDTTGIVSCIATGKLAEIASELVCDEVIAVSGTLRGKSILVDRIMFPDVPVNGRKVKKDFSIVFISDTHFGSKEFLEKEWNTFIKWLNGELGNEKMRSIAEKVKYVIVAGDVVDGVGVYPGQENDLEIVDIYEQYEVAAQHFDGFPKDVEVILSPGNHDAVRQAEPQPALPKEIQSLFPNNVHHVGNPALVDLEGVKVLIYHGRSIDDMVTKIPRLIYEEPHKVMEELLKRRHLSPMYGGRSPIAPEKEDYLVIDDVPDVLHCGHVHTYGTGFYRGVFLVNSSTWQEQTEFQKKVNLNPMPCNVAVYTPGGEVVRLRFYGG